MPVTRPSRCEVAQYLPSGNGGQRLNAPLNYRLPPRILGVGSAGHNHGTAPGRSKPAVARGSPLSIRGQDLRVISIVYHQKPVRVGILQDLPYGVNGAGL